MESKTKEKIDNLFKRIKPIKESGSLFPAEEKELRSSLDGTIEAYESGDYEKSLKHGRKTEKYIYSN